MGSIIRSGSPAPIDRINGRIGIVYVPSFHHRIGRTFTAVDIVLYGRAGDPDSETMRDYFDSRGIDYRMRTIDVDGNARQEWEDLDGQVTPVITIDSTRIVRGLDRTRLENFIGCVGC
jgi:hypothetical protein